MTLGEDFFNQSALDVAPKLLGTYLVHETPEGTTIGKVVETETYLGAEDPASHAFRGKTKRNEVMFGPPGHLYIYFTYGMHYCVNIVCAPEGRAEGVLIRALEPVSGLPLMEKRRKTTNRRNLTNGPAKLTQAMGIDKSLYGESVTTGSVKIITELEGGYFHPVISSQIVKTTRVGIKTNQERPWRFYIKNNPFVSVK